MGQLFDQNLYALSTEFFKLIWVTGFNLYSYVHHICIISFLQKRKHTYCCNWWKHMHTYTITRPFILFIINHDTCLSQRRVSYVSRNSAVGRASGLISQGCWFDHTMCHHFPSNKVHFLAYVFKVEDCTQNVRVVKNQIRVYRFETRVIFYRVLDGCSNRIGPAYTNRTPKISLWF